VEEKELLVARAPIEEEKVLLGSGMLDEAERMVLSSVALVGYWCSLDLFSWWGLTGLGASAPDA